MSAAIFHYRHKFCLNPAKAERYSTQRLKNKFFPLHEVLIRPFVVLPGNRNIRFHIWIFIAVLFFSPSIYASYYEAIDRHVVNTPKEAEQSIQTLAAYLTSPVKNDLEKARAVYGWIARNIIYDTKSMLAGRSGNLSPDAVLKSRRAVCEGYAGLFVTLGQAAGLEIRKVSGYSKSYDYKAGSSFDAPNHAWNAIKIDGKWYLTDSTWGAGYLNNQGRFIREFNDHFFLTPPEQFIYDHFPEDPKWQLLDPPVSMQEYTDFVYLKPEFFIFGIGLKSHSKSIIKTDEKLSVILSAPKETLLLARLKQNNRELDRSLVFLQKSQDEYRVDAVFPRAGNYVLRVYAKHTDDPGKFTWVLDYSVEAGKGSGKKARFPKKFIMFENRKCYLYEPINGTLKAGRKYSFKISVPGAKTVSVIMNDDWFPLEKMGDMFQGNVKVRKGKVEVYGNFTGKNEYKGLLEYSCK